MDSVSQFALGAALGVAVMGRRTAVWKAALWGGMAGTIPDLDSFIDYGDAVRNMTFHRGHSHGLFWLTLGAPALAALAKWLPPDAASFKRWWLAMWLALFTHPLLDWFTVYGTQLLQPFSEHPFGLGSIFIIDPLFTVPLLVGLGVALARRSGRGLRWNIAGLALSTAYLGWSFAAQDHVRGVAQESLAASAAAPARVLVTPTPFNTVLWRVVAMDQDGRGYREGFYSLLDADRSMRWRRFERDPALDRELGGLWAVQRMAWFTHGFWRLREVDGQAVLSDLRMGQEPFYTFSFRVAQRGSGWQEVRPVNLGSRGADPKAWLAWTWQRLWGRDLPTPAESTAP
ncbi:metal-dependent hydrolase [Ramlibacter sp. AW1]|uniref:Metal-dependent hydrolase n=1 Tax=Ramlibacter aurantiacus TaxID=2801330 RepID=A0A936ZQ26_9BURK|nr:metal-dependent hydrolase [Ramlibacter aurantiacus]MBL0421368.1 metal-dependent hydrolase [Ramlibacter aurantiacus]